MKNLNPETLGDLLKKGYPDVTWVWEPFLPDGSLVILSAFMKVGKSTTVMALVKAVATGEQFLGYPCRKSRVLILAVEGHERDVVKSLVTFGAQDAAQDIFIQRPPIDPTQTTYDEIHKFIVENDIGLVVVDTLSMWWRVQDENDNSEVIRATRPLLDIARQTGACVLLVHHTAKMDSPGGRSIRGASSLFAIVDQAFVLRRAMAPPNRREMESWGRYPETPKHIVFELDDETWQFSVIHKGATVTDTVRNKVLDYLEQANEPMTGMEIAILLDVKYPTVVKALTPLPDGVVRIGEGKKGSPYKYAKQKRLT